jgi:hypothetical protein
VSRKIPGNLNNQVRAVKGPRHKGGANAIDGVLLENTDAYKLIDAIAADLKGKVMIAALKAGAKLVITAAKANITAPGYPGDKPGLKPLRDTVGAVMREYENRTIAVIGSSYPAGAHGHLVEFGHVGKRKDGSTYQVPPYPWLRPAVESTRDAVTAAVLAALRGAAGVTENLEPPDDGKPPEPKTKRESKPAEQPPEKTLLDTIRDRKGHTASLQDFKSPAGLTNFDRVKHFQAIKTWVEREAAPSPNLRTHGMATPQNMRRVTVEGIDIDFDPKKPENAAYLIDSLQRDPVPEAILKSTRQIVFTDQRNQSDAYWEERYNIPGFESAATGGDGSIVVYSGRGMSRGTLAHEAGHNMATKKWNTTTPPTTSKFAQAALHEGAVSSYASASSAEDFAESVRLYVTDRTNFKRQFPLKYEAIEEFF